MLGCDVDEVHWGAFEGTTYIVILFYEELKNAKYRRSFQS